jgi:hypothetical protein
VNSTTSITPGHLSFAFSPLLLLPNNPFYCFHSISHQNRRYLSPSARIAYPLHRDLPIHPIHLPLTPLVDIFHGSRTALNANLKHQLPLFPFSTKIVSHSRYSHPITERFTPPYPAPDSAPNAPICTLTASTVITLHIVLQTCQTPPLSLSVSFVSIGAIHYRNVGSTEQPELEHINPNTFHHPISLLPRLHPLKAQLLPVLLLQ